MRVKDRKGKWMSEYRCRRTPTPPAIDARLSCPGWERAHPVSLNLADTGGSPRQATEVRLLYDDTHLYAAFHCVDDDAWGTMLNRKDPVCSEEAVELFLEPGPGSDRAYFYIEIEVSPLNTVYDLWNLNDTRCRPPVRHLEDWTCAGLRTAVHVEGEVNAHTGKNVFWNCEMAVPFAELYGATHIPPKPGDRWRMNLYRIDRNWSTRDEPPEIGGGRPGDEFTSWQRVDRIDFHQPEKFGELLFLAEGEV